MKANNFVQFRPLSSNEGFHGNGYRLALAIQCEGTAHRLLTKVAQSRIRQVDALMLDHGRKATGSRPAVSLQREMLFNACPFWLTRRFQNVPNKVGHLDQEETSTGSWQPTGNPWASLPLLASWHRSDRSLVEMNPNGQSVQ